MDLRCIYEQTSRLSNLLDLHQPCRFRTQVRLIGPVSNVVRLFRPRSPLSLPMGSMP